MKLRIPSGQVGQALLLAGLIVPLVRPAAAGPPATLITLEGEQVSGDLESITRAAIIIAADAGTVRVPAESLHWARLPGADPSLADEGVGRVELLDGGVLPTVKTRIDGDDLVATIAPPTTLAGSDELRVSFEEVASVVFHAGPPALVEQWRRIRQTDATADLIVVKRRDSDSLDFVEGIVVGLDEQSLGVEIDGDRVDVNRERVYGVVCFRPRADKERRSPLLRVTTLHGTLLGDEVEWAPGEHMRVATRVGEVRLPIESVESIDFSRGGVASLSDLEPQQAAWRPFFQPPGDTDLLQAWGLFRRDEAYSGAPLTLRAEDDSLRTYARGLAVRSRGEVTYAAPEGMAWLRATVGMDPSPTVRSDVTLTVLADGQEVYSGNFTRGSPPHQLRVPVSGARSVTLVVDYGANADAGDNLHLANARFTK